MDLFSYTDTVTRLEHYLILSLATFGALTRLGIPWIKVLHISFILSEWNQTRIRRAMSSCFVVMGSLCISFFSISYKLSIGFMSGEFPAHGSSWTPFWAHHVFTDLTVWQGAESCWNIQGCSPYHSLIWGNNRPFSTSIYLNWFILPSTMCKRLVPWTEMAPHTIIFAENLTVFFRHSGKNSSPGRLLTVCTQSSNTAIVDSSEKTTCNNRKYERSSGTVIEIMKRQVIFWVERKLTHLLVIILITRAFFMHLSWIE